MYNCIDIPVDPIMATALSSTLRTNLVFLNVINVLHTNILCHSISCISGIAKVCTGRAQVQPVPNQLHFCCVVFLEKIH